MIIAFNIEMTSNVMTFHTDHLTWQQRVKKERYRAIAYNQTKNKLMIEKDYCKDYLEDMDGHKLDHFRITHPSKYYQTK